MQFNNKHKAFFITLLITGVLVLTMFNFHVLNSQNNITETFYTIEPEAKLTKEQLLQQQQSANSKAETNKAFNQNKKNQRFAKAYQKIAPPEDYVRPDFSNTENGITSKKEDNKKPSRIKKEELNTFSKVNEVLQKQKDKEVNNAKSSVSYSLTNRKHRSLPIPIYLCEANGKIVINITVNTVGNVTSAVYNNASNSTNACLIESALEYAKKARFNKDASKKSQLGSITFLFEGK